MTNAVLERVTKLLMTPGEGSPPLVNSGCCGPSSSTTTQQVIDLVTGDRESMGPSWTEAVTS